MKRLRSNIMLILVLCLSLTMFVGCGKDETKKETDSEKKNEEESKGPQLPDMKKLCENMLAADESLPEMSVVYGSDENGSDLFQYLADFDVDKVDDFFFAYATEGTAEEIAVVYLKDEDDTEDLEEAIEEHVEGRIIQFRTYDPSQVERCEDAVIEAKDNYVILIIADEAKDVKAVFDEQ